MFAIVNRLSVWDASPICVSRAKLRRFSRYFVSSRATRSEISVEDLEELLVAPMGARLVFVTCHATANRQAPTTDAIAKPLSSTGGVWIGKLEKAPATPSATGRR